MAELANPGLGSRRANSSKDWFHSLIDQEVNGLLGLFLNECKEREPKIRKPTGNLASANQHKNRQNVELTEDLARMAHQQTSELEAVNQQLQDAQHKFKEAQRIAHVGHWERDLETDLVTCSEEIYRIFGLSRQDLPIISFQDFLKWVHPDDLTLLFAFQIKYCQR